MVTTNTLMFEEIRQITIFLTTILSLPGSECSGPLGMEGGIISNQQITASSTHRALFGLQKWYPYFARLNRRGLVNAWTAAENDRWPWIQVKLPQSTGNIGFLSQTLGDSVGGYNVQSQLRHLSLKKFQTP